MGSGVISYEKHVEYSKNRNDVQHGVEENGIEYGRRFMEAWFGKRKDPDRIYGASEMGWQSWSAIFSADEAEIHVGYDITFGSPSWACKRMGVEPILVKDVFDSSYSNGLGKNAFAGGSLWNYPVHPSACFHIDTKDPYANLSLDPGGRLTSLNAYGHDYGNTARDATSVHVFFNPAQGPDQSLPERRFDGPSDEQIEALVACLLGSDSIQSCEMFDVLRAPKDLVSSLLSVFGNSPSCYIDDGVRDKLAFRIRTFIKDKPWGWINDGRR